MQGKFVFNIEKLLRRCKFIIVLVMAFLVAMQQFNTSPAEDKVTKINFGIIVTHMAISPSSIVNATKPFAAYLTKKLKVTVKMEVIPDSDTMIKRLEDGSIQMGYVSNFDYIKIKQKLNIYPIVKVVKANKSTYNAVLLVRKDSEINSLKDLKSKTFAYTSETSSHGYLYPNTLIKKEFKIPLEKFFSKIKKTQKDSDGIFGVLYKQVDAVCASSQTYTILSELKPRILTELKIIHTSPPMVHGPMFVYTKNLNDPKLIEKIKYEIINMEKLPEGKEILLSFQIGGWTEANDSDYNSLRKMLK